MRFIGRPLPGGVGVQVILFDAGNFTPHYDQNLGCALAALGVEVELITAPPLFEAVEENACFPTKPQFFLSLGGPRKRLLQRYALLRQLLRAITYPAGLWRTWKSLRERPPGIFHVQWALFPELDVILLRKLRSRGWQVVYTAHDLITELARSGVGSPRRIYRETDAVVVHTESLKRTLLHHSGDAVCEVRRIPEGPSTFPLCRDFSRAKARERLGTDAKAPHVLFFGMIKAYKGLPYLLRAWPRVLQEFPHAKLVIAGEPMDPSVSIDDLIDSQDIRHSTVTRLEYVPISEAQYLFYAADVVVLPYVHISTSGVVPLAFHYSRPVIATNVGGMPEIVEEGRTGFLVPPCRVPELADSICRGLRDPEMLAEMGRLGHERWEAEHSWPEVARQTAELYRSLLPAATRRG